MMQLAPLFREWIANLSSYQINMLRAIASNVHTGFTSKSILDSFNLGSKSNVSRLESSLIDKELIDKELIDSRSEGLYFAGPIFKIWFAKNVRL